MRSLVIGAAVALLLIGPNARQFVGVKANRFAPQPALPTPITECGDITQAGNYVLENDLVLQVTDEGFGTQTCLTISASRVSINLGGNTITVACTDPYECQA